jgi:hypothetical protein
VFSETPPLIVLGLQHNPDGTPKDTTRNIHVSGEFVVNLVDETLAEGMFGINEAGVLTALARGERFGVIAIGQPSIRRHLRYMRQMGLMYRFAGERPLNMSVAETASRRRTLARMIEVGKDLRDLDGADVTRVGR